MKPLTNSRARVARMSEATSGSYYPGYRFAHPGYARSDLPPRLLPIGIAQAALEDLAGIFARQPGADLDVLWDLVVGE